MICTGLLLVIFLRLQFVQHIYVKMKAAFRRLVSWSTDHIRSVKLDMVCFHMFCSLLNVLVYHLWVQFSKSTLFLYLENSCLK